MKSVQTESDIVEQWRQRKVVPDGLLVRHTMKYNKSRWHSRERRVDLESSSWSSADCGHGPNHVDPRGTTVHVCVNTIAHIHIHIHPPPTDHNGSVHFQTCFETSLNVSVSSGSICLCTQQQKLQQVRVCMFLRLTSYYKIISITLFRDQICLFITAVVVRSIGFEGKGAQL